VELVINVGREEWRIVVGSREEDTVKDGSWRRREVMARGWRDVGVRIKL